MGLIGKFIELVLPCLQHKKSSTKKENVFKLTSVIGGPKPFSRIAWPRPLHNLK
jgi:hypothetical protein